MICVFCFKEFAGTGVGEHVIPEALGGGIILREVCPKCNNYLNTTIDNPYCKDFLVQINRHRFGLTDKRGKKAKHPFQEVVRTKSGEKVCLNDDFSTTSVPSISIQDDADGLKIEASIDVSMKDKVEDIIFNKIKRYIRDNHADTSPKDQHNVAKKMTKDIILKGNRGISEHDVEELHYSKKIDLKKHLLEYIKIAYEMGCYCYGFKFTKSQSGQIFRAALTSSKPRKNIRGTMLFQGLDALGFDDNKHYIFINKQWCYIRLLGIPCVFSLNTASVTPESIFYNDINDTKVFINDFTSKEVTEMGLGDFIFTKQLGLR